MAQHNCEQCKFRAKYDKNPRSILGRLWRWHINWCPGWKRYVNDAGPEKRLELVNVYHLKQQ